ncbi:MAG: hypothetical protein AAF862_14865 [Pseudomonadota bacterium]
MFKFYGFAAVAAVGIGNAHAATFDFSAAATGNSVGANLGGFETFSGIKTNGITVTAGALGEENNGDFFVDSFNGTIRQFSDGIGVRRNRNDNTNQVDGSGPDEGIRFFFSAPVEIESIDFTRVDGNDEVTVLIDEAGGPVSFTQVASDLTIGTNDDSIQFIGSLLVDRVILAALDGNDNWTVSAINIAHVPVPGAAILFASALGLAGVYRRRAAV